MTSYYDMILGLIPLALFGIGGMLALLGVQITLAVPAAASVAVGLIGHALFVNQPEDPAATPATDAAPVNSTNRSASISAD